MISEYVIKWLSVFAVILCASVNANVYAQTLTIGIGLSKPPYVIQEKNAGAEYEIIERALNIAGYKMKPRYMPLLRITHELNGGAIDAGMNMRAHMAIDGFFSDVVMTYQNFAVTKADSPLNLKTIADLSDKSLVAFQNAHKLLGAEFTKAVKDNKKYAEIANQALQVKMLAAGRVQIVVADFRIFLHFKKQMELEMDKTLDVKFHRLFNPTPYRVAFRNRIIRDKFDQGIAILRETGEYDRILAKYISPDDLKQFIGLEF